MTDLRSSRFLSARGDIIRFRSLIVGVSCASAAMGLMWWICELTQTSVAALPFTTSIVIIFGAPGSQFASSWNIVGGHIFCTVVTLSLATLFGYYPVVSAISLGLGIGAMTVTRTFHPPAGINAVIIIIHHLGWTYLIAVGAGSVLLALAALAFRRWAVSSQLLEPGGQESMLS